MRKWIISVCLPLACLPVLAQDGASGMSSSRQLESAGNFRVLVPKDLPEENREETRRLLKQLQQACPSCSDGGTVGTTGGGVIIGPGLNRQPARPLWPTGSETVKDTYLTPYVTIPRSEYRELRATADKYNALLKKLETAP